MLATFGAMKTPFKAMQAATNIVSSAGESETHVVALIGDPGSVRQ